MDEDAQDQQTKKEFEKVTTARLLTPFVCPSHTHGARTCILCLPSILTVVAFFVASRFFLMNNKSTSRCVGGLATEGSLIVDNVQLTVYKGWLAEATVIETRETE